MKLDSETVRSLTLPTGKVDHTFYDDELPGFGLRIWAGGAKTWVVRYKAAGKARRIKLGTSAALSPSVARRAASRTLAQITLGSDPAAEKRDAKAKLKNTIGAILPDYLEYRAGDMRPASLADARRHLMKFAEPLHDTPIANIDRATLAILLKGVAKQRGPRAADKARASLSKFFMYAIREGFLNENPAGFLNRQYVDTPRKRLLSNDELRRIWRALPAGQFGDAMRLLILTGCRRNEIGWLRWSEVDFTTGLITLPPERHKTGNKTGRIKVIPMSDLVRAILLAQPKREGRDLIFGKGQGGLQNWGPSRRALDARLVPPLPGWWQHDFRRLVSTRMHEDLRIEPHIVDIVLSHAGIQSGTRGRYNLATYEKSHRVAMQRWADYVLKTVDDIREKSAA